MFNSTKRHAYGALRHDAIASGARIAAAMQQHPPTPIPTPHNSAFNSVKRESMRQAAPAGAGARWQRRAKQKAREAIETAKRGKDPPKKALNGHKVAASAWMCRVKLPTGSHPLGTGGAENARRPGPSLHMRTRLPSRRTSGSVNAAPSCATCQTPRMQRMSARAVRAAQVSTRRAASVMSPARRARHEVVNATATAAYRCFLLRGQPHISGILVTLNISDDPAEVESLSGDTAARQSGVATESPSCTRRAVRHLPGAKEKSDKPSVRLGIDRRHTRRCREVRHLQRRGEGEQR